MSETAVANRPIAADPPVEPAVPAGGHPARPEPVACHRFRLRVQPEPSFIRMGAIRGNAQFETAGARHPCAVLAAPVHRGCRGSAVGCLTRDRPCSTTPYVRIAVNLPPPIVHVTHLVPRGPAFALFRDADVPAWRSTADVRVAVCPPSLVVHRAPPATDNWSVTVVQHARGRPVTLAHVDPFTVGHAPGPLTRSPGSRTSILAAGLSMRGHGVYTARTMTLLLYEWAPRSNSPPQVINTSCGFGVSR